MVKQKKKVVKTKQLKEKVNKLTMTIKGMKEKQNNCDNCYVTVKQTTIMRGIVVSTILLVWSLTPIMNLVLSYSMWMDGRKYPEKGLWEGCWYDMVEIKVKQE